MDSRPIILVVRLWPRPEGLIIEVRSPHSDERRYVKSIAELLRYLETFQEEARAPRKGGME